MHHDENDDSLDGTDGVPALFTGRNPLEKRNAVGIVDDELGGFEVNAVFGAVESFLFSSHSIGIRIYSIVITRSRQAGAAS